MTSRRVFAGGLGAAFLTLLPRSSFALPQPILPSIRREYVSGKFGQIHLRIATPDASAITQPPLVLLHQTALSGRMFERFLALIAKDRVAIAVDTPGYGESDRPAERPGLSEYGDAIMAPLINRFGDQFDVLGYHTGAAIAADIAARFERVRRLVLVSMPYFQSARRLELLDQLSSPKSQNEAYADDGSHLLSIWQGTFNSRADGQSRDDIARLVAEKQRAGRFGEWALLSVLEQDLTQTLKGIKQPVKLIVPHDGLQEEGREAASLISNAEIVELPDAAFGLFDAMPQQLADMIVPFLTR